MPVIARFHELRNRTVAGVDHVFAEPVKLSFLSKGEVDLARTSIEIEAILRIGGERETSVSGEFRSKSSVKVSAAPAQLFIDASTYAGPVIRVGDAVRALARNGQPWFEVLHVSDRGETRIILSLGEK